LYDASTGHFIGKTPSSLISILGQMSFCDPSSSQNPLYCVKTQSTFNAPQITNLKSTDPQSITVNWINPQDYPGGVGIYIKPTSEINWPQQARITFSSSTPEAYKGNHTATTTGLSSGTSYDVKVRGWLK
jgi:hypothetical protein